MTTAAETTEKIEVLFAIEGHKKHFQAAILPKTTVAEFVAIAMKQGGTEGIVEVFLEDADNPLAQDLVLAERLNKSFAPLHVARPGQIRTTVRYQGRNIERSFPPSKTIARIIEWAIGPDGFKLEGPPTDYQLKHDGLVLTPDEHLGQVARGQKAVELDLVFNMKPQG